MTNSCIKARNFFGVVQRIYTIFANSTKRWKIWKDNVKGLTPKSLSSTRWESRVESVKAIRTQMLEFTEALLEVSENDLDPKIQNEAKSLAINELGDFEFLMAIIIWFEILSAINSVSKLLQEKDMLIDVVMQKIKGLISYFEGYRETSFYKNLINYSCDSCFCRKKFFKIEVLLKTYLRSTMSQERLNGLTLIAIQNDILETIKYEDLVDDFASKSVRRKTLFM
ncbi:hypothetical protein KIW84_075701 [Lathyrus oleraceus]|uniref:Zinc finger MYM-type protein 1-like n=1 Tax=Pisum sativum TaxID=3888 RepID=A0A9D5A299_PEA|nr:hypothetical protein KIW84_075701 [Pisum sativum]